MKAVALVVGIVALTVGVSADTYRVSVRKIDRNVYLDTRSKTIIETRYCYGGYTSTATDAILNWEGRFGDNWLVFIDGSREKCDVVALR